MTLYERNSLIDKFLPLVALTLQRLVYRLPREVDRDDLHSAGVMGLIDAISRYVPERAQEFPGYAAMRIKGSMLDELRRLDPTPRRLRSRIRQLNQVTQEATSELGRPPTDGELADRLGISVAALDRWQRETPVSFVPFDHVSVPGMDGPAPLSEILADGAEGAPDAIERREKSERLAQLITKLPAQARKILAMSYVEGMSLGEIAEGMDLTESRICQIRQESVALLRRRMATEEVLAA